MWRDDNPKETGAGPDEELHLQEAWYRGLDQVLARIRTTQRMALAQAADRIVTTVTNGGLCHLYDTGHMLMHELVGRAGGLLLFTPIYVDLSLRHPARFRPPANPGPAGPQAEGAGPPGTPARPRRRVHLDEIPGMAEYILSAADCRPGDVLILGSVSGASLLAVELALEAKQQGLFVIGLTSVAASQAAEARHPSGKRLYEVVDLVLDHQTPPGDALVPVDAVAPVCPASGIAAAYLMWALTAEITARLLKQGRIPSVLMSNHLPGAGEHNRQARERYQEQGY